MLLRFFRINDPYRLLGVLVVLVLLSLAFFIDPPAILLSELRSFVLGEAIRNGHIMYAEIFDSCAPATSVTFGIVEWIGGRSLTFRHVLALLVIFFQASYFAVLLIQNKAYNDSTYVPAVIFGILCFFSFDLLSLSPELLASTILLFALNNLFKEIEFRIERDEIILNLGVYLGVASLLVFSYTIFLLGTILILIQFTRLTLRNLFLLLFGFALPHALLIVVYFMWGETAFLFQNFYAPNVTVHGESLISVKAIFTLAIVPLVYFVFSLFMLNREARFTKYQSQLFQVMFEWMFIGLVQILVTRELTPHSMIIFIPSFAYFISHYLLLIRRKWIAETMLWIFLIGVLSVSLSARYHRLEAVDYSRLFPAPSPFAAGPHDAITVLKEDEGAYLNSKLAGYFLDWKLSEIIFDHPDYYENVILVEQSLRSDPPDRIIDPNDRMRAYFERLPQWSSQYKREPTGYRRIGPASN